MARPAGPSITESLGPGLITGAADDDPGGIATYAQVGAAFGFATLWTVVLTLPLMAGIQIICARIGRVSGDGLAANIRDHYPRSLLYSLVGLLVLANTINIAADVSAMGAALALIAGGPAHLYAAGFGLASLLLQVFVPFGRYVPLLKVLTLSLFAYVGVALMVDVPWRQVLGAVLLPPLSFKSGYVVAVVAVFGTTISPYLFFWQASQEVEQQRAAEGQRPLRQARRQARWNLQRIGLDTWIGMAFSNLIAFFVMLTAAVTLHRQGILDIHTSAEAAQALRPLAGEFAFLMFASGIIGTGMLAVPILAASAAYAVAETFRWRIGLGLQPWAGRGFYLILSAATLLGVALNFTPIDPIRALFWSAVLNGVAAVPMMMVVMSMASRSEVMGPFVIPVWLRILGWAATVVMTFAVIAMAVTWPT